MITFDVVCCYSAPSGSENLTIMSGVCEDRDITKWLKRWESHLTGKVPDRDFALKVEASGPELLACCGLLGRQTPFAKTYTFVGDNAREIALNWANYMGWAQLDG